jgi:hypothetical protein
MDNLDIIIAAQAAGIEQLPEHFDLEDLCIEVESLCINAGGNLPHRQSIIDAVQRYGSQRVWNQAQYLWDRVASATVKVEKPTAWFFRSVEGNWSPPGAPRASIMQSLGRMYATGELRNLSRIPERYHTEIERLAQSYEDGLSSIPF